MKTPLYISKDEYMKLEAEHRIDDFANKFGKDNDIIVYSGKIARFDEVRNKTFKI